MVTQRSFLAVLFYALSLSVDSFVINNPSSSVSSTLVAPPSPVVGIHPTITRTSTCLWAEEENETETADEEKQEETEAEHGKPMVKTSKAADDILNSPAFLKRKIDVLKSDIAKVEERIEEAKKLVEVGKAEWGPQLDDLRREYKNIQERMSSQNKQGDEMATTQVVREMLDLLDNFDRAFGVIKPQSDEEEEIVAEYKAIYQSILDTFEKLGVKTVETLGKEFDYEVHQAVMQKPSDEYEEGVVCEELQRGFIMGATLIRPAMVVVAA